MLVTGKVPEGLDLAVMKMKKGETALVFVPPQYAFGDEGSDGADLVRPLLAPVPPGAAVTYEVELLDFTNVSCEDVVAV